MSTVEELTAPDGRSFPLLGVTIEALQLLAADSRITDDTTTEQACQHIFMPDGMPEGWSHLLSPVSGTVHSSHSYRCEATEQAQEEPPPGTRSIVQVHRTYH
jgi:hypothetical protein